jgi:hypothetical protein
MRFIGFFEPSKRDINPAARDVDSGSIIPGN